MPTTDQHHIDLSAWPSTAATRLRQLIGQHAHSGQYAVFDADQTLYGHDLTESLLAYLEHQHILTRANLAPELQLMPFQDHDDDGPESLYAYYMRLCALDDNIGYPWIAQCFAGLSLQQLKAAIDELMAYEHPIPIAYVRDGQRHDADAQRPTRVRGMQQLVHALQSHGIAVYIVSAGHEEAIRMILADAQYGYHVPPEQVIGVTTLLRHPQSGHLTTARQQISAGTYDAAALLPYVLTTALWAPLTWYEGKTAAIKTYIDAVQPPILVAGDTPNSDGPMLFEAAAEALGGIRLFIERSSDAVTQLNHLQALRAGTQEALGLPVSANLGWLIVTHADLA